MAGKATIHSVDYDDDDVEASAASVIDDGENEHITVCLEMVAEHTRFSVEHTAVHIPIINIILTLFNIKY